MDATAIFLSEMGISDLPDVFKGEQLKKETILFLNMQGEVRQIYF